MSYIYFIQTQPAGMVKIGFTALDPRKRLSKIQTDCPWPIELIGTICGTVAQEKQIHLVLAPFKTQGEWFEPHPIVIASVREAIRVGRSVPAYFGSEWQPRYDHPLCIWLARNRIRAMDFAERIGITPGAITGMYRDGTWVGRDVARKIYEETAGEVTPTDFMLWNPSAEEAVA